MSESLSGDVVAVLACPKCGGAPSVGDESVHCAACNLSYPVRRGIPIMLAEAATAGRAQSDYARHVETSTESIEFYDTFYKDFNDYKRFQRADIDFTRKLFRKLRLPSKARVLDLGSGTGYFHSLIEKFTDLTVYSADFSFEGFRAAREHFHLANLVVMDAYEPALRADSFDAVVTIGLTPFKKREHADIVELVRRVIRPLRSGGYYVFVWSTNLSGRVEQVTMTGTDGKPHVSEYYNHTRAAIARAFADTGQFAKIETYAFIRPLSHLCGPLTFTRCNTLLTEAVMKVAPRNLSARLMVIGRKA